MKVKSDFVTNSSSTCYVVMIPSEFKLQDHLSMLEKGGIFNRFESYMEFSDDGMQVNMIENFFDKLLEEGNIIENLLFDSSRLYMWIVIDICRDLNFIIADYDLPYEGNNLIVNIGLADIFNRIKEIGGLIEDKTRLRDKQ